MSDARRLWLIDAGYMLNAQRSVANDYQFDYLRLRNHVETDARIWRAYYLNATPEPPSEGQEAFHNWLRTGAPTGPGIITKLYPLRDVRADRAYCDACREKVDLQCPRCGGSALTNQQQKGVDVGLATLALAHRDNYDTLTLSAGDGDLLDAVEYLSERGKGIELVVFRTGVSTELQCRADRIWWINDFPSEVERVR